MADFPLTAANLERELARAMPWKADPLPCDLSNDYDLSVRYIDHAWAAQVINEANHEA